MTHRERAELVYVRAGIFAISALQEERIIQAIHGALIEACNDELGRRREVEGARDRAMRIQAALEMRCAWLEQCLQGLRNVLTPVLDCWLPGDRQLQMAADILQEFEDGGPEA